jgi:hypothetical protein
MDIGQDQLRLGQIHRTKKRDVDMRTAALEIAAILQVRGIAAVQSGIVREQVE